MRSPPELTLDVLDSGDLADVDAPALAPPGPAGGLDPALLEPLDLPEEPLPSLDLDGPAFELGHGFAPALDGSEPSDPEAPPDATRDVLLAALEDDPLEGDAGGSSDTPLEIQPRRYSFLAEAEPTERRSVPRLELGLPVVLRSVEGERAPVTLTSGSVDAWFVRSDDPLELDAPAWVTIEMLGNLTRRLPAVVVRRAKTGFVIQLDPDPQSLSFRAAFLELAQEPGILRPKVEIEARPTSTLTPSADLEDELGAAWGRVLQRPEDEDVNQAFIHECMRARNLDFAVDRYREQLAEGNARADRYLQQLGTILGFYSMTPRDDISPEADGFVRGRVKGWVALTLALLVAFGAARWLLGRGVDAARAAPEPAPSFPGFFRPHS